MVKDILINWCRSMRAEEEPRQHEQPAEAGNEIRQGNLGIQGRGKVSPEGKVQDALDFLQLPTLEKV